MPAVSIITPTYNHAAFIAACVDSVLRQSFSDWELLVLDDGSTDDTGAIVQGYRDPRVRYSRQEHAGIAGLVDTYNRALAASRAPLVAILEGDDYWPPDKLERLVPAFADDEVVLAYGVTEVLGGQGYDLPKTTPYAGMEEQFPAGTMTNTPVGSAARAMLDFRVLTFTYPCSVVLRRAALQRIGGFQRAPDLLVTDYPTFFRMALEGRFHFEQATMGYWRVHDRGTTVREGDRILRAMQRQVSRYLAEFGERLQLGAEQRRAIEVEWERGLARLTLRRARKLLVERRWEEARAALVGATREGRRRTRLMAAAGLLATALHRSVEPLYRFRGRPWLRLDGAGAAEWVE